MRSELIGLALCLSLVGSPAMGEVLYEIDTPEQLTYGSYSTTPFTKFTPLIHYEPTTLDSILASVFSGLTLTQADIGKTFISSPLTDPGFAAFANYLTDGNEQYLFTTSGPGGAGGTFECNYFQSCGTAVDLQGYEIDQVTYTINAWRNEIPGRDLWGNGIWYDLYYGHRITIEGHQVPEPTTLAAALLSALGLMGHRWRLRD
jgi:hypothetical protein